MRLHDITLRDRFPAVDGLRAIGALAVMTTHVGFTSGASVQGAWGGFLARLDIGVALFFVVSGFLLYRPHVVARMLDTASPSTRPYLWHRAVRILPALWVAVLLAAVTLPHADDVGLSRYLRHALLVQIYQDGQQVAGLTQLWSLATEAAFYLLLPGAAVLLHRLPGSPRRWAGSTVAVLALTVLAGPAWMAAVTATDHSLWGLWLPGYLGWFGLGMALAVWNVARASGHASTPRLDELAAHPWTCWAFAAAAYAFLTTPVAGPLGLTETTPGAAFTKSLAYGLVAALVVLPTVSATRRQDEAGPVRSLGSAPWAFAGGISYGFFLYHVTVLAWLERVLDHRPFDGDFLRLWVGTLLVTAAVASASYHLLERPLMRRGRRDRGYDVRRSSSLDDLDGAGEAIPTATTTPASTSP
ncbi:acyltransferase [Pedococcus aerophilus]|uniref:Acyltransferase n=1 Tax=Pedococcus aerophilus TaxID=436356 RepID=A0ABP6GU68_9MICO